MASSKTLSNLEIIIYVLRIFILWKIAITVITLFGLEVFTHTNIPGLSHWYEFGNDYITRWANWDGGHYLTIAENGYLPIQVVFFPLYPLLIKLLMIFGIKAFWGGIIISHIASVIALFYLYKLTCLDFKDDVSKKALFFLLAFPTSFYLTTIYSESLFLALAIPTFYYGRRKRWLLAFILAGLTAVTRLMGIFVIISIMIEYFLPHFLGFKVHSIWKNKIMRMGILVFLLSILLNISSAFFVNNPNFYNAILSADKILSYLFYGLILIVALRFIIKNLSLEKIKSKPTFYFLLSFIPFLGFLYFLQVTQNNPLAFIEHEQNWGRELISPWESFFAHIKYFSSNSLFNGVNGQSTIEFIFFISFLLLLIYSFKKLRLSYNFYFFFALLIPTATGTYQSIHRYVLIIFPIFIALALIEKKLMIQFWTLLSIMFLGIFSILFINGLWVS